MMSELLDGDILAVLQKSVIAAVEAVAGTDFPIKAVGRTLDPPNSQKYVEIVFIPNNREGDFYGDEMNYQGMLRIVLHWPNDNSGAYAPILMLRDICRPFTKDELLRHEDVPGIAVQLLNKPNMMSIIDGPSETLYPAGVRYQLFQGA